MSYNGENDLSVRDRLRMQNTYSKKCECGNEMSYHKSSEKEPKFCSDCGKKFVR